MKGVAFAFAVFSLLLAGCEPAEVKTISQIQSPPEGLALLVDRVKLPEGNEVIFNGRLLQYQYLKNTRGEFDRYTIRSSDSLMATEGSIFSQLAKAGYTRRIRAEEPGRFIVNYLKKGRAPIVAAYTENVDAAKQVVSKSQLILTLKAFD